MSERGQRLRLGAFVVVSLLLLAGLIVVFGGAPRWFLKRDDYTALFEDAPGVTPGTPVRKSGQRIGEVGEVRLDPETGDVHMTLRIDPAYKPREGEVPTISRHPITGDTAVDFVPKDAAKPERGAPYQPGTIIRGVTPPSARQILEGATDILPEAERSLNQIRVSMQKLEQLAPQLNTTLREVGDLARAGREYVPELRRTTDDLRELFANAKDVGPELRKTNEEIRYFLRTASTWTENIGLMLKTNEPRIQELMASLTRTLDRASTLLNDDNQKSFNELLKNVTAASRPLEGMMKESDAFIRDGRGTLQQFNKTLTRADEVLTDLSRATKPLGDRAPRVLQNLESGSDQLNRALLDIRQLLREVARSDGTLNRFLTDPSLYNNVDMAALAVAKMMPRLDRILNDLEVFADKIARHPEALGVGGAVRPSAGLKTAPGSSGYRPPQHP